MRTLAVVALVLVGIYLLQRTGWGSKFFFTVPGSVKAG